MYLFTIGAAPQFVIERTSHTQYDTHVLHIKKISVVLLIVVLTLEEIYMAKASLQCLNLDHFDAFGAKRVTNVVKPSSSSSDGKIVPRVRQGRTGGGTSKPRYGNGGGKNGLRFPQGGKHVALKGS